MTDETHDDLDEWENAYFSFLRTLEILNKPVSEQCEEMANYNVAWELRDEALDVDYLIPQKTLAFTDEQLRMMQEFSRALHAMRAPSFLEKGGTREENLKMMEHPDWQSVREIAKKLVVVLASRTEVNYRYLNMRPSS